MCTNKVAIWLNLIPSFPWIAPPRPPPWRNPRKGRDQILPSGNHGNSWQQQRTDLCVGAHGCHDALLDEELLLGAHLVPPQPDRLLEEAEAEVPEEKVILMNIDISCSVRCIFPHLD